MIHNSTNSFINESIENVKDSSKNKIDMMSELFSFDSSSFDEALHCLTSPPFFSELKMIVIDNVQSLSKEQNKKLAGVLPLADKAVVIMSTEGKADKTLVDKARELGRVIESRQSSQANINLYIEKQFSKAGKKVTRQASNLIAQKLGNDEDLIKSEINKIIIFSGNELIDIEDIKPVLSESPTAKIFELIDAVSEGNVSKAMQKLGPVARSMEPLAILNMLKRHYRLIAKSKGLGSSQIMAKLRQPQFVAQKLSAQSRKYTITSMRKAFHILLTAEKDSKSGKDQLFSVQKALIDLTRLIN